MPEATSPMPDTIINGQVRRWPGVSFCSPRSKPCLPLLHSKQSLRSISMSSFEENSPAVTAKDMLIGAMLRVPAEAIHRRILRDLNAAGFKGLSLPHVAVFRFPGPDGVRPGVLAERAGMSKQAMNRLLGSLEDLGYLIRSDAPDEGRARIVRFTKRDTPRGPRLWRCSARSSANGGPSLARRISLNSRNCFSAFGRAR
jgi:DNA-binding MarR family transcriptional regulator